MSHNIKRRNNNMASILHRITIDAPPEEVQPLLATKAGLAAWWTGHPLDGDEHPGGELSFFFEGDKPAAVMEVVESDPDEVAWRCVQGPAEWIDTRVSFTLEPRADGGTTLLFRHEGWAQETEFMGGCTTNWGAYLTSLKHGAEGGEFGPYPAGEVCRWS
jgi:uncharacterized protein YndB with AHSA1/START domain